MLETIIRNWARQTRDRSLTIESQTGDRWNGYIVALDDETFLFESAEGRRMRLPYEEVAVVSHGHGT